MRDFAPRPARTLRVIDAVDGVGPLSIPAGTPVVVVGFESLGALFGQWLFEHAGRVFKAQHDALDVQLPGGQAMSSVGELVDELLSAPPPTAQGAPLKAWAVLLLAALGCASGGVVFDSSYKPSAASTGRLHLSVVHSDFVLDPTWDTSGKVPVLVVEATSPSHPGRAQVQVRTIQRNEVGGTVDSLLDFRPWDAIPGCPAKATFRFHGHGPALTSDVYLVVVVSGGSVNRGAT